MIDFKDAEKALEYLKATDIRAAKAKAHMEAMSDRKKTILAVEFIKLDGSAAEKTQKALASEEYDDLLNAYEEAILDYETIRNQRKSAELQIELWRSINSNQRRGNI